MKKFFMGILISYACQATGQDLDMFPVIDHPEQTTDSSDLVKKVLRYDIVSHSSLQKLAANLGSYPDMSFMRTTEPSNIKKHGVNYLVLRRTGGPELKVKFKEPPADSSRKG